MRKRIVELEREYELLELENELLRDALKEAGHLMLTVIQETKKRCMERAAEIADEYNRGDQAADAIRAEIKGD